MTTEELKNLAIHFVDKGYVTMDSITYSDDLYDATEEEKDECMEHITDIIDNGMFSFKQEMKEVSTESKDIYSNNEKYSKETDPEVTCWHCKKTFLCDAMDAVCRLCGAPYNKSRCDEFNFTPKENENISKYSKEHIQKELKDLLYECLRGANQECGIKSVTYDEETQECVIIMDVTIVEEDDYIGFDGY